MEPTSEVSELLSKCLEEAKAAGMAEGKMIRRAQFYDKLEAFADWLGNPFPDLSAIAPEHQTGYRAGYRAAMRQVLEQVPNLGDIR